MQPFAHPQPPPDHHDRNEGGHRGPLIRTWPQLFKKRRRYSPVRESAQQQQQQQQQHQHQQQQQQQHHQLLPRQQPLQQQHEIPYQDKPLQPQPQKPPERQSDYVQIQPQQPHPPLHQMQIPIHTVDPLKSPSTTTQSIASPVSSLRSPSMTAETASTLSSVSYASSAPTNKIPISRRSSSIVPANTNGAGGVTTPQADLLASKSNYELISSGEHLEMGLHFSTAMATGVMMKRATHRAAEQARRDRMKTAMVDLAEFLLDGEVTFGSGTTCFVVMRGDSSASAKDGSCSTSSAAAAAAGADGSSKSSACAGSASNTKEKGPAGEKRTVNKARLIEMALEKMKAQEREIEMLRKEVEELRTGAVVGGIEEMDVGE